MAKSESNLTLQFSEEAIIDLEKIQELSGLSSTETVVQQALQLYHWYLKRKAEGYKLLIKKDLELVSVEFFFRD